MSTIDKNDWLLIEARPVLYGTVIILFTKVHCCKSGGTRGYTFIFMQHLPYKYRVTYCSSPSPGSGNIPIDLRYGTVPYLR